MTGLVRTKSRFWEKWFFAFTLYLYLVRVPQLRKKYVPNEIWPICNHLRAKSMMVYKSLMFFVNFGQIGSLVFYFKCDRKKSQSFLVALFSVFSVLWIEVDVKITKFFRIFFLKLFVLSYALGYNRILYLISFSTSCYTRKYFSIKMLLFKTLSCKKSIQKFSKW